MVFSALSQRVYIDQILSGFDMQSFSLGNAPIMKGDKFSKSQCPQDDSERTQMQAASFALIRVIWCVLKHVHDLILLMLLMHMGDTWVILVWITGNLQRKYWGTCIALKILCSLISDPTFFAIVGYSIVNYTGCPYDIHFWLCIYDGMRSRFLEKC